MIHKLRYKILAAVSVLGMLFGLAGTAFGAAALNWQVDTTVTINSEAFIISGNSEATSMTNATLTLTVTVPSGSTFTLRSVNRRPLNNDQSLAQNCTSGDNSLVVNGPKTSVIITPDTSTTCTVPSGGGGGGGGSPSPTPAPAPTPTPTPTPTPAPAPAPTPTPTPTPSPAPSGAHSNGTLVNDNGTIYLIKDGKRIGFRNEAEYKSHGYNFGQAVAANAQDKALPQEVFVQKALEGTLVLDLADGRTVYMIGVNGTKRGFVTASVFTQLGYNFANLPKINLTDYPSGAPVGDAVLAHPDGALVLDGKTVWWVRGNARQGFESEAVFNTYGFSFSKVVTANAADKLLAQGALVKFRDGTLVKDGADYYLISDGKKLKFVSSADLTARGYKTSNAINASLAAYASGGNVQ